MVEIAEKCDFKVGDCIDGKYIVEKALGEGTFGKVFKVKSGQDGAVWALKLFKFWEFDPETRKGMCARAQMEFETGQIKSDYLVHSVAYGTVKGNPFIVMEFCPNGDLPHFVKGKKGVDWTKIGRETLYGLKDLHRNGKIHRDLKPENVLIKSNGVAALTDFGISGDRAKRLTAVDFWGKPKEVMGTYIYMAPEQAKPKNHEVTVLPTMDIFAFGVMLYKLITGDFPFGPVNDQNDLALYIRNAREGNWNRQRLSECRDGRKFEKVIDGCLIPDFKQRLQTVDTVLSMMPQGDIIYPAYQHSTDAVHQHYAQGLLLRIMQGEEHGVACKLNGLLSGKSRIVTVGRNEPSVINTLPITENLSCYISRKHCTFELGTDNQWYIRDGQWDKESIVKWKRSLNGTYVNSTEVTPNGMPILPGDIITIGDVKLRVEGY